MDKTDRRYINDIVVISRGPFSQDEVTRMFLHLMFVFTGITDLVRFLRELEVPGRTKIASTYRSIRGYGYPSHLIIPDPKQANAGQYYANHIVDWGALKKEIYSTEAKSVMLRDFLNYLVNTFTLKEIINELQDVTHYSQSAALGTIGQICNYQDKGTREFSVEVKL